MQSTSGWDVFVSHASEDKDVLARPLAEALRTAGLSVWFDEFALTAGDSLSRSIDYGLENSKYGIVLISPSFLAKKWPQRELAGLFAKEDQAKVIIPVWHNVSEDLVRRHSPILADRVALKSTSALDELVRELLRAMNLPFGRSEIAGTWFGSSGRLRLFKLGDLIEGDYDWNGHDWHAHLRGRLTNDTLVFDWWWDYTPERGGGFFRFQGATLEGEWWMGQGSDGLPIPRDLYSARRNEWRFQRAADPTVTMDGEPSPDPRSVPSVPRGKVDYGD